MKKAISICLVMAIAATVMCCTVGCNLGTLTEQEAKVALHQGIEESLKREIFYWKELNNRGKDSIKTTFNKYCLLDDKDNILYNDNGEKKNFAVKYNQVGKNIAIENICGTSSPKGAASRKMLFEDYAVNGDTHKTMQAMTVEEYLAKTENKELSLSSKLYDLAQLKDEDIIFDGAYNTHNIKIKLITLTFKIADDYFVRYAAQNGGRQSVLKGKGITVEIAYDKIAMITIFDETDLGGYKMETEVYRLDIVYIGPIVKVPDYTVPNVWQEI